MKTTTDKMEVLKRLKEHGGGLCTARQLGTTVATLAQMVAEGTIQSVAGRYAITTNGERALMPTPTALSLSLELQRRGSLRSSEEVGALEIIVRPEQDTPQTFRPTRAACFRLATLVEEITAESFPRARWVVSVEAMAHRVSVELANGDAQEIAQARAVVESAALKSGIQRRINRLANFWWPETPGRFSVLVKSERAPVVGDVVRDAETGKSWRADVVKDMTAHFEPKPTRKYEIQGPETAAVHSMMATALESFRLSE